MGSVRLTRLLVAFQVERDGVVVTVHVGLLPAASKVTTVNLPCESTSKV